MWTDDYLEGDSATMYWEDQMYADQCCNNCRYFEDSLCVIAGEYDGVDISGKDVCENWEKRSITNRLREEMWEEDTAMDEYEDEDYWE